MASSRGLRHHELVRPLERQRDRGPSPPRCSPARPEIEETIAGLRYRVSAGSFFQVNVEIVGRIFEFLEPAPGGRARRSSTCTAAPARSRSSSQNTAATSTASRRTPRAVAEARSERPAQRFGAPRALRTGRVEELVGASGLSEALREAGVVFLDPPRKGCDEVTLGAIAAARVPHVWYLSCDPATLARDLKFLAAKGYRLGSVQPFDMFPQTGHVETLVQLEYSKLANRDH